MGGLPSGQQRVGRDHREGRPAVGLIAAGASHESIRRAVRRASDRDYEVLVVPADEETADLVRSVGGTVVRVDDEEPSAALAAAARSAGFPGLLLSENCETRIDYSRSRSTFRERDSYVVPTVDRDVAADGEHVVVGIPAYDEGETIARVVDGATEYADEVVVVDDGSSDQTARFARRAGAVVIRHSTNRGKGAALRSVFDYAERRSCSALVLLDGDGQHTPRDIPGVVRPVLDGDADLVIGSRYLRRGMGTETPLYRRVGQRVLDRTISLLFGVSVSDTQSGFRALSPAAVEAISIRTDGMAVETEMLDAANRNDLVIEERPIRVQYEGLNGQTYNPVRHGVSVLGRIVQLVARGVLRRSPSERPADRAGETDGERTSEGARAADRRGRAVAPNDGAETRAPASEGSKNDDR